MGDEWLFHPTGEMLDLDDVVGRALGETHGLGPEELGIFNLVT